jgi:AcrR family transcriptional regulator
MSEQRSPRRYSSRLRDEQAAQTRARVIRAAAQLFAAQGYAATSLPQIARAADVSTETVQGHGPKVRLLLAAVDALSFGTDGATPVLETPIGSAFRTAASPEDAARISADILAAVNGASLGLWLAFSEAARTDAAVEAEFRALAGRIRAENAVVQRLWRERGWLRDDVPDDELARWGDVIGSVEVYDRVVRVEGGSVEDYKTLISRLMSELMIRRN